MTLAPVERQILHTRLCEVRSKAAATVIRIRDRRLTHARKLMTDDLRRYWVTSEAKLLGYLKARHPGPLKVTEAVGDYDYSKEIEAMQRAVDEALGDREMRSVLGDGYEEALRQGWGAAFSGIKVGFGKMIPNRLPIEWVQNVTARLGDKWGKQITDTMRTNIYDVLAKSYEARDTFNEMLAKVSEVYGKRQAWDEAVVRTETNRAYCGSEHVAYKSLGFTGKYWILSGSPYCYTDVCADNAQLGEIGIDEPFYDMDGGEIQFAGDAHPNDECSTGYITADDWEPGDDTVMPDPALVSLFGEMD